MKEGTQDGGLSAAKNMKTLDILRNHHIAHDFGQCQDCFSMGKKAIVMLFTA